MQPLVHRNILLIMAFSGLALFTGTLAYGDILVAQGVPCDTSPASVPICRIILGYFWVGAGLVGFSLVLMLYWRFKQGTGTAQSRISPNRETF